MPLLIRALRLVCGLAALLVSSHLGTAQTVIQDSLYRNYTQIWGTSPDGVNLPGATYAQATGWSFNQISFPVFDSAGGTNTSNGTGIALSLASSGSYVKPTAFTVSVEVNISTPSPITNTPFAVLGFYAALEPSTNPPTELDSRANFTGLLLASDGTLSLVASGTAVAGSSVAYAGGTFSPGSFYTLSYSVDTTTGALSGVSLEGSTADYSSLINAGTPFSAGNTAYLGFGQGADFDPFKGGARFINLSLVAIPEPSRIVLGLGSLIALFLRRRAVRSA